MPEMIHRVGSGPGGTNLALRTAVESTAASPGACGDSCHAGGQFDALRIPAAEKDKNTMESMRVALTRHEFATMVGARAVALLAVCFGWCCNGVVYPATLYCLFFVLKMTLKRQLTGSRQKTALRNRGKVVKYSY